MGVERTWMSWSGGKDAALALERLRADPDVEVAGLLTTASAARGVVPYQEVGVDLIAAQAEALRLPLHVLSLPEPCPNADYEAALAPALAAAAAEAVTAVAFGDLALADVRAYREALVAGAGLSARFPLWDAATPDLAGMLLETGIAATLTCVDTAQAPAWLAGRAYDAALLADLPDGVDPCGERGEFHTFVTDAPGFAAPIVVEPVAVTERDGYAVCGLALAR
ncbi:MAG: hypothetical protein R6T85_04330 [Egibacteraceae bacterium]